MDCASKKKVGVLALQGSVIEHVKKLEGLKNVEVVEVKTAKEVEGVDGLIIPGGESTTLGKLLNYFDIKDSIVNRINGGMPVWGTCAGMILLAKEIVEEDTVHLGVMDISVKRNAYGSQLQSFTTKAKIAEVSEEAIPLTFIRAPWIEKVWGDCKVIHSAEGKIVAARQKNMLATSFHPELTEDSTFHEFFCNMIK